MFFKTKDECAELMSRFDAHAASAAAKSQAEAQVRVIFEHEPAHRMLVLARHLVSFLESFDWSLLWVTGWGVWGSGENWHLYYRLRQSYGDHQELYKAPGHFFLGHETAELITFLDMAIRFGWDCHLVANHIRYFVSHDGWLSVDAPVRLNEIREFLADSRFRIE